MNTIMRPAEPKDLLYIDSLRKKEGSSLGFIPIDAYKSLLYKIPFGGRRRWEYQTLTVTEDNGDLTGFCYASFYGEYASIIQIVIQDDARRWQRASLLENDVRITANILGKSGIKCRVAYDLESNYFWSAIGYVPIARKVSTWLNQRESNSKRPIIEYCLYFELPLFKEVL